MDSKLILFSWTFKEHFDENTVKSRLVGIEHYKHYIKLKNKWLKSKPSNKRLKYFLGYKPIIIKGKRKSYLFSVI